MRTFLRSAWLPVSLVLAVVVSLSLWLVGWVPFDLFTITLHGVSIYIGAAAVALSRRRR